MKRKGIWLAAVIIVLVAGISVVAYLCQSRGPQEEEENNDEKGKVIKKELTFIKWGKDAEAKGIELFTSAFEPKSYWGWEKTKERIAHIGPRELKHRWAGKYLSEQRKEYLQIG